MLYLVDGYNITRADPATSGMSAEEARIALLARLSARGAELLGKGRIVVVFDGPEDGGVSSARHGGVEVRFSRGEDADDVIVRLAASSAEDIALVSGDRELAERVRSVAERDVTVLGREKVFESARPRGAARRRRGYPGRAAGLPPGANRITQELKDLWLPDDDEE